MSPEERTAAFRERFQALRAEIGKVLVGQEPVVDAVLTGLLAGGHVLLEGLPGLGKTLLVRTLSRVVGLGFARIQFTPDLMPADIVGTNLLQQTDDGGRRFEFAPGPVFCNLLLADEINRATPKTQSALLEAMQEQQVTVAGVARQLPQPYLVLATQNPIDLEGTYPLPEAQLDRFLLKVKVPFPSADELGLILDRTTGTATADPATVLDGSTILDLRETVRAMPLAPHVRDYAIRLVLATHPEGAGAELAEVKRYVRFGASPRGCQALILGAKTQALLAGRYNVAFEDVDTVAHLALRHRVILNFEAEAAGINTDRIIDAALAGTPALPEAAGKRS